MGHEHLHRPPDRGGEGGRGHRPTPRGNSPAARTDLVDHGTGDACRHVERRWYDSAHGGSNARRLGRAPAAPDDPRRGPNRNHGGRPQAVPGPRRSRAVAQVRDHARRGRSGRPGKQLQCHGRVSEPGWQRASRPLTGPNPDDPRPRVGRGEGDRRAAGRPRPSRTGGRGAAGEAG